MLRVGTAGWSYPDWDGIVYPKGSAASGRALQHMSRLFDVLEINVTFYRPPSARMTQRWVERVSDRPTFRFTAKLWQGFTHSRDQEHLEEERAFNEGMMPLTESGRLGCVLVQFPHSFHNTDANRDYLESLLERFGSYRLVVELRHKSWMHESIHVLLTGHGVGLCNIDQPAGSTSVEPTAIITAQPGYVRLHGRNQKNWFSKEAGRDERYDYLYSHSEITEWADRLRLMQGKSKGTDIFVIANNHYRGQAPANALELIHLLTGGPVPVPESLVRQYPRLDDIADRLGAPGESGRLPL
jgi:uncharacterized protein YecE (DUF72 family)